MDCTEQVVRAIRAGWQPGWSDAPIHRARQHRPFHAESLEPRQLLASHPVISEFMALNESFLLDDHNEYSDWIELHNPTPSAINLDGYYLTDDADIPKQWRIPAVTLPADGRILIFASGTEQLVGLLHAPFSLEGSGEYLALVAPDGTTVVSAYAPEYPEQLTDRSYGFSSSGAVETMLIGLGSPARYLVPTPGTEATWKDRLFNDSGWTGANVGVGFELNTAGAPLPSEVEANDNLASADDARSNFQTHQSNLFHLGLKGTFANSGDFDHFRIGSLTNGDVLTVALSGVASARGTLSNPRVELLRGSDVNNLTAVTQDDDSGPGSDALINRLTVSVADTYYVRVVGITAGTYDLSLHLANSGAGPGTGGTVTTEAEPNNTAATSTNAGSSWRAVQYRSRTTGTVGSTTDWFRFQFTAGDLVTVELDATQTMDSRVSLYNAAGTRIAYDDGTAAIAVPAGNDAYLYGFVVPTTGAYYVLVEKSPVSTQTASYALNVYLSSGTEPPREPLYTDSIATSIQSAMHGVNASAYVRVPFVIEGPDDVNDLKLRVKFDDGFVAYLNGAEVARRNAPGTPAYNSTATDQHLGAAFEEIDLTPFTGELVVGQNVLAFHALNVAANDRDLLLLPELIATRLAAPGESQYFATPTPNAPNDPATLGVVADTKFSLDRGFYDAPFQLAITTATVGAQIRYTLDGTPPTATNGFAYNGPITIDRTTTLRAAAFRPGFLPSNVDTQTYLFLDDVIRQSPNGQSMPGWPSSWGANVVDYGMDPDIVNHPSYGPQLKAALKSIPTFSITMDLDDLFDPTTGIYSHPRNEGRAWERPASVELIKPNGTQGFQSNAGIRIRGGFSRSENNPKHAFRLFFRDEYGDGPLEYPVFGANAAQRFEGFDLRTFQNYSWSFQGDARGIFLRDQLNRDTQLAMGHNAERGDYYHLYINGVYWGLYNSAERAEASYGEEYFGGDEDDFDVVKHEDTRSTATDGNTDAWLRLWSLANADLSDDAAYYRLSGRDSDGTVNPALENLVDVENLIDYMLVIYYGGNLDAPISQFMSNGGVNNFYAMRSRVANEGFRFFAHDSEHTYLTHIRDGVREDRTGPFPAGDTSDKMNPQWLFQRMWQNEEFRLKVADHVHRHFFNGGALTPNAVANRFNQRRGEIELAVHAESARWGDSKTVSPLNHNHWLTEINNILANYIPQRSGIVLDQLRGKNLYPNLAAPVFSQFGGIITPGYNLTMTAPGGGTIYYTTDGSDPRRHGGAVSPGALTYVGGSPLTLSETTRVRARVLLNGTWSALADATFSTSLSALRISEVMYHPAPAGPNEGTWGAEEFEYVELLNTGPAPVRLTGVHFTSGIEFTFGDVRVQPGERVLIVKNRAAFEARYGTGHNIAGEYADRIDNAGEKLRAETATNQFVLEFTVNDDWYAHTDGAGYSLVAINPAASTSIYPQKANWRPSFLAHGKPGEADPGYAPGQIAINEMMASDPAGGPDWIEIHNFTDAPADIGGWFLSDDEVDRRKYVFPAGTTIAPNGFLVLYEDQTFGRAGNPGVVTPFTIDHVGDSLYLSNDDDAGNLGGYRETEDFDSVEPGVALGRHTKQGGADFVAQVAPTPGAVNVGPRIGPVVINELLYFPAEDMAQFVELRNVTGAAVPLFDPANPQNTWQFTRGITFAFPEGATIPANGFALVVPIDPAVFRAMYGVYDRVPIYGPFTGVLSINGENVELSRPGVPGAGPGGGTVPYHAVDRIAYEVLGPWPNVGGTPGNSIGRRNPVQYGNDFLNWRSEPLRWSSPGATNQDSALPTVDIVDVAPDPHAGGVDSLTIRFSEIVRGFEMSDLTLTRGGGPVSLAGATLSSDDDVTWVLGNLASLTATEGDYTLALPGESTGVVDLIGRPMFAGATETFTVTGGAADTVIAGTEGDDTMLIRRSGENLLVWLNADVSLPPTMVVPIDPFGTIEVSLLGGDDRLVLELADGESPLPDEAVIDGGAGVDVVEVLGTAASDPIFVSDGTLSVGSPELEYVALEGIELNLPGAPLLALIGATPATLARTFRTDLLALSPNARLDIAGHGLIVDATPESRDALARALFDLVKTARDSEPRWSGRGLTSSAIGAGSLGGVATMINPGLATFNGEVVDANAVLVGVTYNGDANLDGRINADDYFRIDQAFLAQPQSPGYNQGDFNYDGSINADDYFLIDQAFLGQSSPAAASVVATTTAAMTPEQVEATGVRKKGKAARRADGELFQAKRRVAARRMR